MSTNNTWKPHRQANTGGTNATSFNGQQLTVELLTADPSDLATNYPRVWINLTSGTMKFCLNGSTVKTVTAT